MTILLVAGALGLTGCGGAAHPATTTRAASNRPTEQDDAASSTAATSGGAALSATATSGGSTAPARRSTGSRPARKTQTRAARPHRSTGARSPRRSRSPFDPNAIEQAIASTKAQQKRQPPAVLINPPVPAAQQSKSRSAAVACMHYGGLYNVARRGNGGWVGTDPSNGQLLYVAGPYRNASVASGIAKSLARREYARSGGLYVGFATFRGALSGELKTVSGCLAHGGPKRTLVF